MIQNHHGACVKLDILRISMYFYALFYGVGYGWGIGFSTICLKGHLQGFLDTFN
jgi:hypothetical protein